MPGPISLEDVRVAIALLETIVEDRALLADVPAEERQALILAAGRASRPARHEATRLVKEFRRRKKQREQAHDRDTRATAGIRAARQSPVFVAPAPARITAATEPGDPDGPTLKKPKSCYVCKTDFTRLHFFYDALCADCASFNYDKRFQSVPLDGRVAVITGARVKIGFQTALKVLRAGGTVVATTRFPHDAAQRYARETDFDDWKDRLQIHGLDLRHSPSVEMFTRHLEQTLGRLDILVNNACQTVRRPPEFYSHLLDFEARRPSELPGELRPLLRSHEECVGVLSGAPRLAHHGSADATGLDAWHGGGSGIGLVESAQLSQISYAYDDATRRVDLFPQGALDVDLQQVDLRTRNTWRLTLAEVATPEMLEVHLINAVAPFILCSKLKPLMARDRTGDKHIVNVSAMEGIFSRGTKTDRHPHTNMAKAALNMMTLTSAKDYVRDGIHMNAVDTGWVTDEDPAMHATRKRDELDFQPPLDIVDGAARICDPFFYGLLTGLHVWGKFLKDYKPSAW